MPEQIVSPSRILKKTIRFFFVAAAGLAALSILAANLFRNDINTLSEMRAMERIRRHWSSYKSLFIDKGRVFRPKNDNDTVSEGQAYAMIQAVWFNDRQTFDEVYKWTEDNISRFDKFGDHLLAWRYEPNSQGGPPTIDYTPALDADMDYTLALFVASKMWPDGIAPANTKPYREKAVESAGSIMQKAVMSHPNGELILLPWLASEFSQTGVVTVNPSYFSPGHCRVFEYETGDKRWGQLADDFYRQIEHILQFSTDGKDRVQVVPDWINMTQNGGFAIDPEKGFVSGWDAFRIWWRLRLDYDFSGNRRAKDLIETKLNMFITNSIDLSGGYVATESNRDGTPITKQSNPGMLAAYGWSLRDFQPQLSRTLIHQAMRFDQEDGDKWYFLDKKDYYTNSWAWLSLVNGKMQSPLAGYYRLSSPSDSRQQEVKK